MEPISILIIAASIVTLLTYLWIHTLSNTSVYDTTNVDGDKTEIDAYGTIRTYNSEYNDSGKRVLFIQEK